MIILRKIISDIVCDIRTAVNVTYRPAREKVDEDLTNIQNDV